MAPVVITAADGTSTALTLHVLQIEVTRLTSNGWQGLGRRRVWHLSRYSRWTSLQRNIIPVKTADVPSSSGCKRVLTATAVLPFWEEPLETGAGSKWMAFFFLTAQCGGIMAEFRTQCHWKFNYSAHLLSWPELCSSVERFSESILRDVTHVSFLILVIRYLLVVGTTDCYLIPSIVSSVRQLNTLHITKCWTF